jgi:hypothetical protein
MKPFLIASVLQSPITPLIFFARVFRDLGVFQLQDGIGVEAFFAIAALKVVARNDLHCSTHTQGTTSGLFWTLFLAFWKAVVRQVVSRRIEVHQDLVAVDALAGHVDGGKTYAAIGHDFDLMPGMGKQGLVIVYTHGYLASTKTSTRNARAKRINRPPILITSCFISKLLQE